MESNIKLLSLLIFGLASLLIYGNNSIDSVADLIHDILEIP